MPVILAPQRWEEEGQEFKAIFGYTTIWGQSGIHEILSKQRENKQTKARIDVLVRSYC